MATGDVFIVDDNPHNLALLSKILGSAGYRVRAANRGRRALEMIQALPPDLVMLDVMMPEMDGYEVCQRLKADPATREIPVMFISALSEAMDKLRGFAEGAVDYVTKPFDAAEVLARVDTQLRLYRLQRDKNRFLGMAAHDLRSPLTVLVGYSEFLAQTPLTDEQRDFVDQIRTTTRFMQALVSDLLDLSAIEAGRLQLNLEE